MINRREARFRVLCMHCGKRLDYVVRVPGDGTLDIEVLVVVCQCVLRKPRAGGREAPKAKEEGR